MMVMAMIASLQAVGVVMSIGLLILGMISAVTGLLLSYWVNLPSGRAIVMVLSAVFVAAFLFGPRYGVVQRLLSKQSRSGLPAGGWRRSRIRNVLFVKKCIEKLARNGPSRPSYETTITR